MTRPPSARASLRVRLTGGLAVLVLGAFALSISAVAGLQTLGGAVGTILRENYDSVIACEDMAEALERMDSAALFSTNGNDAIARPMLATHRRAFVAALEREQHNVTLPLEGPLVARVTAEYADYVAAVDRTLDDPASRTPDAYFRELLPRFARLREDIHAILRMNQSNMEEMNHAAKALAASLVRTGILVTLAVLALAIWLVYWLPRLVLQPLEGLRDASARIGAGDLDAKVPPARFREHAPLADAFAAMQARLRVYRESSLGELLAAKDLARSTVACIDDPVLVFGAGLEVLLVNPAAERAFGVEQGPESDARPRAPAPIRAAAEAVLGGDAVLRPSSLADAWPDTTAGMERYYLTRAASLQSERRDQPRVLVVAQDVTRLRTIDALKSSVVGTVSHELKTPLTSLRMATHLLLETSVGPLNDSQRELVVTARDEAERLRQLVEAFLDLTRIEAEAGALRRSDVDLGPLLARAALAHRSVAAEKELELRVSVPPADPLVASVDPEKMGVALANLIANAVRHTPSGGLVELRARREGATAVLEVSDTGEGIDAAELPRIFDRFHRGRGAEGSRVGLGLSIAREIAEQHGGALTATSLRGSGTCFTLRVPLS